MESSQSEAISDGKQRGGLSELSGGGGGGSSVSACFTMAVSFTPHGGAPPNPSVGGKSALLSGLRGRDGALVGSA